MVEIGHSLKVILFQMGGCDLLWAPLDNAWWCVTYTVMTWDQELLSDFCPKMEWNDCLFLLCSFCLYKWLELLWKDVRLEIQWFLRMDHQNQNCNNQIFSKNQLRNNSAFSEKVWPWRLRFFLPRARFSTSPTTEAAHVAAHVTTDGTAVAATCQPSSMVARPTVKCWGELRCCLLVVLGPGVGNMLVWNMRSTSPKNLRNPENRMQL